MDLTIDTVSILPVRWRCMPGSTVTWRRVAEKGQAAYEPQAYINAFHNAGSKAGEVNCSQAYQHQNMQEWPGNALVAVLLSLGPASPSRAGPRPRACSAKLSPVRVLRRLRICRVRRLYVARKGFRRPALCPLHNPTQGELFTRPKGAGSLSVWLGLPLPPIKKYLAAGNSSNTSYSRGLPALFPSRTSSHATLLIRSPFPLQTPVERSERVAGCWAGC
jgi:hypothetical protein